MYKKKGKVRPQNIVEIKPYAPKEDNKIYIIIQRQKNRLTPIPYKYKPNYNYIKTLLNDTRNL